jgi:hypothetical protein
MKTLEKSCLRCKFFRLKEVDKGVCRVEKKNDMNYPLKGNEESCPKWQDGGQQYYIRLGWIKARKAEEPQEG